MPSIALRWSSVRVNCCTMFGLFQNCPFANPNASSTGGRCCAMPGPIPCPPGPCALARPPAIRTPTNAKNNRTDLKPFIVLSSPLRLKGSAFLAVCWGCPVFLVRTVVVHHLSQRLHRRRNLPRNIAVHGRQQILILGLRAILGGAALSNCGRRRLL